MSFGSVWPARRASALGVAVALALGTTACGNSDDDGQRATSGAAVASSTQGTPADRAEIADVIRSLRSAYNATDGTAYCAELTPEGRQRVRDFAATVPQLKARTCDAFIAAHAKRVLKTVGPQRRVRVRDISVRGGTARIVFTGGIAGGLVQAFKLENQDGDWKLINPISGGKTQSG